MWAIADGCTKATTKETSMSTRGGKKCERVWRSKGQDRLLASQKRSSALQTGLATSFHIFYQLKCTLLDF